MHSTHSKVHVINNVIIQKNNATLRGWNWDEADLDPMSKSLFCMSYIAPCLS